MITFLVSMLTLFVGMFAGYKLGFSSGDQNSWQRVLREHIKGEEEAGLRRKSNRPRSMRPSIRP
jgi:hypothetical protein